ncbi:MAG: anti-sigma factor family protein [Candidatus Binatia bacterium]
MNCQEIKELSSDYLDQQLTPPEVSLFETHLNACSACRQELETLRTTVSLIATLDEVETSPAFLDRLHGRIERRKVGRRIWAWLFEPLKFKVPLEVTALLLLSILGLQLYSRSPQIAVKHPELAVRDALEEAQVRSEKQPVERVAKSRERYRMDKAGPQAKREVLKSKSQGQSAGTLEKDGGDRKVASVPQLTIKELVVDDVTLYEGRVKTLLRERGGKVLVQGAVSPAGFLMTVQVPRSRESDFLTALRAEESTETGKADLGRKGITEFKKQAGRKAAVSSRKPTQAPGPVSSLRSKEPLVTLKIRILPRK